MSAARPGIRYIPALDGLRALAVMGVLLYHHDEIGMFRGGYVGVDVFFVISGYLITSLLITEFRGRGRVSLTTFYVRRAKRLLPAMLLVVAVSSIVAATVAREFAVSVRGDAIASLFYVNNWWQLSSSQPYGQAFAGHLPLLQHLWSLAIEEQFYLLWPIVVIIGLRWAHGKPGRLRQFALTVLGLGVVSGIAMWVAYSPADPSAIYYPTHLHAFGLLFGSVLAMGWRQHRLRADIAFSAKALLNAIALFGLAVLYWVMTSKTYDFYGDNLHRSLLISSLVSVLIVGAIVHPAGGMVSSVLSWRPFTWIGERSYGIYLWHILVFYFVDTEIPLVPKLPSLVLGSLRIIITVVIAHFSYELLESPIRYGRLGDAYRTYRSLRGPRKSRLRRTIFVAASVVVVTLSAAGVALAVATPDTNVQGGTADGKTSVILGGSIPGTNAAQRPEATSSVSLAPGETTSSTTAVPPPPPPVLALGDSVMLGAARAIVERVPAVVVNAAQNRQFGEMIQSIKGYKAFGPLQAVVIHGGTNGRITQAQLDEMLDLLKDANVVVFFNLKVPGRGWEEPNNALLSGARDAKNEDGTPKYPNFWLVDWKTFGELNPTFFYKDGIHLNTQGQTAYGDLVLQNLRLAEERAGIVTTTTTAATTTTTTTAATTTTTSAVAAPAVP